MRAEDGPVPRRSTLDVRHRPAHGWLATSSSRVRGRRRLLQTRRGHGQSQGKAVCLGDRGRRRARWSAALFAAGLVVAAFLSPWPPAGRAPSGHSANVRFGLPPEPSRRRRRGARSPPRPPSVWMSSSSPGTRPRSPPTPSGVDARVGPYRHYLSERSSWPASARHPGDRSTLSSRPWSPPGLHPGAVSTNDLSIPVRATAAQLSTAFATGFKRYRLAGGRIAYANTAPRSSPDRWPPTSRPWSASMT